MDILIEGNIQGIGNILTIAPENIAFTKITKSALRLIVNETAGKVLYRHMAHDNITDISYDNENEQVKITFASSVPVMTASDAFSVKLYVQKEDIIPTDYAKETTAQQIASDAAAAKAASEAITGYALQGSNDSATNTAIISTLGTSSDLDTVHTVFGYLAKLKSLLDLVDTHVGSDTLTLNEKLDIIRTVIGEISLVQNDDNVGSGNQAWTLVLNQSLAVNNEIL